MRIFCKKIENYKFRGVNLLNATIYLAIGVTSLLPCFQSPLYDSTTKSQRVLDYIDVVMTILFLIEVIVKVISKGFFMNGPKSYLR